MGKLLRKEITLTMHPTVIIFMALSMMLLIPNYPYYVVFFYTGLAVFFTCLNGREYHDVFYTMSLPVAKKEIVKARFLLVMLIEIAQMIIAIPFAMLRQMMPMPGNEVGMDANIALFGLSLIMVGIFNCLFFISYYKDVTKVGKAFIIPSIFVFLYIGIAETCAHVVPFFRDTLDTPDTKNVVPKLIVLAIGIFIYAALTGFAYLKSVKNFEKLDL